MRRGEIWVARLNSNKGNEMGKMRPVLILQDDQVLSSGMLTVLAIPLTTQYRPSFAPLRVKIQARDRLLKDCFVVIEQIRALDRSRFSEGPLTILHQEEMAEVEKSLKAVLGLW